MIAEFETSQGPGDAAREQPAWVEGAVALRRPAAVEVDERELRLEIVRSGQRRVRRWRLARIGALALALLAGASLIAVRVGTKRSSLAGELLPRAVGTRAITTPAQARIAPALALHGAGRGNREGARRRGSAGWVAGRQGQTSAASYEAPETQAMPEAAAPPREAPPPPQASSTEEEFSFEN